MNQHIPEILQAARRIAVVGLSDKKHRTSSVIAEILLRKGYEIIPVNPTIPSWEGIPSYPDLRSVPGDIDIVNVFRRSEFVSEIIDEAIAVGAKAVWTQQGIVDLEAARRAEAAGLQVVMDRCIAVELSRAA